MGETGSSGQGWARVTGGGAGAGAGSGAAGGGGAAGNGDADSSATDPRQTQPGAQTNVAGGDSSEAARRRDHSGTQTNPRGRALRLVSLGQVAREQERVVRRDQLHALGWTHSQIQHEIAVGRWHAPAPSVIAMQNAPLVHRQRLWLGVLHAHPHGVLSHRTACTVHGLQRWDDDRIDVLTHKGDLVEELPGFFFHQTRREYAGWVHGARRLPTLRVEHAALLAAERDDYLPRAVGLLAAVVQQRLSTTGRLLLASRDISKLRHGRVLRLSLGDIAGGAQSFAEISLRLLCAEFGLRPPDRQQIRLDRDGRRRYLDCEWDLPGGQVLVLEIDGSFHYSVDSWVPDMKREREVVLSGRTVLRCSSVELRINPSEVMADLAAAGIPRDRPTAA